MQQVGTARLERKYRGSRGVYFSKTEDRAVLRGISPGAKYALDLGTGAGRFAFLLAGCAEFAIGVDIRIDGLEVAKDRIPEGTRVAFANMEGATLGFRSESFDLVTAVGTFECTQDLRPILREVARVLAADGYVIFTCWNEARWPKLELLDRRAQQRSQARDSYRKAAPAGHEIRRRSAAADGLSCARLDGRAGTAAMNVSRSMHFRSHRVG